MLYIERDQDGKIIAIHQKPGKTATEQKTLMDEEILEFLRRDGTLDSWIQLLSYSDVSIIRVLEDLIDVLVKKNVIMLTDLPPEAKDKILERKRMREKMGNIHFIVDDIL